jgi:RsiW-degrading membrane proteinase PrsW (M82 family)
VNFTIIIFSFLAGILPALIWLIFLLREDARCPEPKQLIALTFLAGMVAVAAALPIEHFVCTYWNACVPVPLNMRVLLSWALIEETLKYAVVAIVILWRRDVDESVDYVIYMITAALGFAALENALFLYIPFSVGQFDVGFLNDNLRFVGATLLHVVASSAIGFAMAFSAAQNAIFRIVAAAGGLILAAALHTLFNFLIISQDGSTTLAAFFTVWTGVLIFFILFEVLKYYRYRNLPKNVC